MAIVLLGIIEGITEFLPVSSTGHLLIAEHWLPRQSELFNVVIQCGAVLAVLPLFPERCQQVLTGWKNTASRDYLLMLLLAFVITGIGGVALEKLHFKLPENVLPVATALIVGGIAFVAVEYRLRGRKLADTVTWSMAVLVGLGQLVAAVFPGSSRSGVTILLLLIMGMSRPAATEFSFLVGVPTMMAAGGLKIFKALQHGAPPEHWSMVLMGFVVAAIVSFISVKWLLRFIQSHTFIGFGWYRIAFGIFILVWSSHH
jgi:undecaprenyl-diphosphatase